MNVRPLVLVAEDDPVFRRLISFSIEAAGMRCLTASNGLEAKECLQREPIDLVITDHQMPLCSGLELIAHIRQDESGTDVAKRIQIILCTAKGFELDAAELTQVYDLLAVLRKPFSPRQMVGLITASFAFDNETSPCPLP